MEVGRRRGAVRFGIWSPLRIARLVQLRRLIRNLTSQHEMKLLYPILTLLLATVTFANPAVKAKGGRLAVPFGVGAAAAVTEGKNAPIGGVDQTANYVST
jgi:hypothetical protein